jgi:hypothetical protein
MALSSEIEAKSPDPMAPQEMKLPSMEPVPAPGGAPGLLGLLSRPVFTVKLCIATLLLGAVAILLTPAAFPPRVWRRPPLLPARAPARWPHPRVSAPVPAWMRGLKAASPQSPTRLARPIGANHQGTGAAGAKAAVPKNLSPWAPLPPGPIRIHEPAGAIDVIAPNGVTVAGKRIPAPWARAVRRLFAAPAVTDFSPSQKRPTLRLLEPNPGDAAVFNPPDRLRWAPAPGVGRYLLTVEALTDPAERVWAPVQDLLQFEVSGTEFLVPPRVHWASGALYRWRVQTGDEQTSAAGRFRVLSTRQRERLLAARQWLAPSWLLRAAIDRSYGLYNAALADLLALRPLQPHQPALRRAILNVEVDIRRQRAVGAP